MKENNENMKSSETRDQSLQFITTLIGTETFQDPRESKPKPGKNRGTETKRRQTEDRRRIAFLIGGRKKPRRRKVVG